MYRVYYYIHGNLYSKDFPSFSEATHFAVYKVSFGQCGEIIKLEDNDGNTTKRPK